VLYYLVFGKGTVTRTLTAGCDVSPRTANSQELVVLGPASPRCTVHPNLSPAARPRPARGVGGDTALGLNLAPREGQKEAVMHYVNGSLPQHRNEWGIGIRKDDCGCEGLYRQNGAGTKFLCRGHGGGFSDFHHTYDVSTWPTWAEAEMAQIQEEGKRLKLPPLPEWGTE